MEIEDKKLLPMTVQLSRMEVVIIDDPGLPPDQVLIVQETARQEMERMIGKLLPQRPPEPAAVVWGGFPCVTTSERLNCCRIYNLKDQA